MLAGPRFPSWETGGGCEVRLSLRALLWTHIPFPLHLHFLRRPKSYSRLAEGFTTPRPMIRVRAIGGCATVYVVVSYTAESGHVVRPGLSLVQAYRLVGQLGRGAVFRSQDMSVYARPVYPRLPEAEALPAVRQGRRAA